MYTTRVCSRRELLGASLLLSGCGSPWSVWSTPMERAALLLDVSRSVRLSETELLTVALEFVSRRKGLEVAIIPVNASNGGMLTLEIPKSDPTGYGDIFRERVYEPVSTLLPGKLSAWREAGSNESNYEGAIERAAQFLGPASTRTLAIIGDMEHYVKSERRRVADGFPGVPTFADSKLDLTGATVFMGIVEGDSGKPSARFLAQWQKAFEGAHVKELCVSKYGLDGFKDWCAQKLGPTNPAFEKWVRQKKGVSVR